MAYTTADLIASVNLRAFAPVDATTFSNNDLLILADEEIQTILVPHLAAMREEYFVVSTDISVVANQAAYDIPVRAAGLGVRSVQWKNSSGGLKELPLLNLTDLSSSLTGTPCGWYMLNNSIMLYPTPNASTDSIRVHYQRAPSKLVLTTAAGIVTSVNSTTVTCSAGIPTTMQSGSLTLDAIKATGGQEIRSMDVSGTGVSATAITVTDASTYFTVGDYVALSNQSPLIQFPPEYRAILAQAVTARVLQSMRLPGASDEQERLKLMLDGVKMLVSPRSIGQQRKIVSKNWW